ncbi:MAG: hypothetical protein LBF97_08220 [Elusimicrobiota bacterium]|jgi:hypothetical protein|nr:hypothetical protein [Elusimicrobiota bacterium]
MFIEVDKNLELLKLYSKYQIVNLAFLLVRKEKKNKERHGAKIIVTDLLSEVITKLSNNEYTKDEIKDAILESRPN